MKDKYFKLSILSISGIIYFVILKKILIQLNGYFDFILQIQLILYILLLVFIYFKKYKSCIVIYYISLFVFLFLRKTNYGINLNFYLFEWLKKIFDNKIIFINIIGNIIIFIPLGIINRNILKSILIIIAIETIQLILKKGIFDIVDIVLNTLGSLLGYIGVILWMKIKKIKKKKKK